MNIKLLVCDLDDTLLTNGLPPSERTINAIKRAQAKGVHVAVATGRMHISALPYAKILNADMPLISYNGALIKDYKTDEVISETTVYYDDAVEVLEFAKSFDVFIQYYSDTDYFFYEHCYYSDLYHKAQNIRGIAIGEDLAESLKISPEKLLISTEPDKADIIYEKAKEVFDGKLNITRSSPMYVEFNNPLASKGQACKNYQSCIIYLWRILWPSVMVIMTTI